MKNRYPRRVHVAAHRQPSDILDDGDLQQVLEFSEPDNVYQELTQEKEVLKNCQNQVREAKLAFQNAERSLKESERAFARQEKIVSRLKKQSPPSG